MEQEADSPAAILERALTAARQMAADAARRAPGDCAVASIPTDEFATVLQIFSMTPGTTIHDAKAFIWAAEKLARVFQQTVMVGHPSWDLYGFVMLLYQRASECIDVLAAQVRGQML